MAGVTRVVLRRQFGVDRVQGCLGGVEPGLSGFMILDHGIDLRPLLRGPVQLGICRLEPLEHGGEGGEAFRPRFGLSSA